MIGNKASALGRDGRVVLCLWACALMSVVSDNSLRAQAIQSPNVCPGGDRQRCVELGDLYNSKLLRLDPTRARGFYEAACALGSPTGCDRAADVYEKARDQDWQSAHAKADELRAKAVQLFSDACEQANASACWLLATDYQFRVPNAAVFYGRALQLSDDECRNGRAVGCYDLARHGRREDVGERWPDLMRMACDAGIADACSDLAWHFRDPDPVEAVILFEKACAAGNASSCQRVADAYHDGRGAGVDEMRALELDAEACIKGSDDACATLGAKETPPRGTVTSQADVAQLAVGLLDQACQGGDHVACVDLADALRTGLGMAPRGVAADIRRSMLLYESTCQAGQPKACVELGLLLGPARKPGPSVSPDAERSTTLVRRGMSLYQEQCDASDAAACAALGQLYLQSTPVGSDRDRALALLAKGCGLGHGPSCREVADVYRQIARDYDAQACRNGVDTACIARAASAAAPEREPAFAEVQVFFATDRARSARDRPAKWWERSVPRFYGGDRAEALEYGICAVTIPRTHQPGELEQPSVLSLEFEEDPGKHVVLKSLTRLAGDKSFFARLKAATTQKGPGDVLLFIHGFNVSFEDAVRRAAVLEYDLSRDGGFSGVAAVYSWPSRASLSLTGYTADLNSADSTVERLRGFLTSLVLRSGARRVHVIAHSMGNRALTAALQQMALLGETKLANAVFAAPDVDVDVFRNRVASFLPKVGRVTLYASSKDRAIQASRKFNGGIPRAGDGGDALVVVNGMDTIDASSVDSGLLGHSYFAEADLVLRDLYALIKYGFDPPKREGLTAASKGRMPFWILNAAVP